MQLDRADPRNGVIRDLIAGTLIAWKIISQSARDFSRLCPRGNGLLLGQRGNGSFDCTNCQIDFLKCHA